MNNVRMAACLQKEYQVKTHCAVDTVEERVFVAVKDLCTVIGRSSLGFQLRVVVKYSSVSAERDNSVFRVTGFKWMLT